MIFTVRTFDENVMSKMEQKLSFANILSQRIWKNLNFSSAQSPNFIEKISLSSLFLCFYSTDSFLLFIGPDTITAGFSVPEYINDCAHRTDDARTRYPRFLSGSFSV